MNPIQINVQLDCTDRLESLLTKLLCGASTSSPVANPSAPSRRTKKTETPAPSVAETPAPSVAETSAPSVAEAKEEKEEAPTAEKPISIVVETKEIGDEEIRAAVKTCRQRLLSDCVPEDVQGRRDIIMQRLKEKVSSLGATRSVELPQSKRPEFVLFCQELQLDDLPF